MNTLPFFATAPKGISDLLVSELQSLGATATKETRAGVQFEGPLEVAYRACLWSRLANRILLPVGQFQAESADALYHQARQIDWSQHMDADSTLAVDANLSGSAITHSHFAALRIKDAIVDQFFEAIGERPNVDVDRPDVRINGYIHRNEAQLYIDLSGASLHERGYRQRAGAAPLKENLAAAILMRAGWADIAAQGGAFVDPMCGSGTLVLEAAMIAGDVAPGLNRRHFGLLTWKQHDDELWQRLVTEASQRETEGATRLPTLLGFDHDRQVLDIARDNAERLGIEGITFAFQDIREFRHDFPDFGLVATNPPYGKRLLDSGALPELYGQLGRVLRQHFVHWKAAVLTQDAALGKAIGIRSRRQHTLYNGPLLCKLIHFDIEEKNFFNDSRLPGKLDTEKLSPQSEAFGNRLEKRLRQLQRWANREGIDCYRIYDADLPDYAAAIDLYSHRSNPDERWICIQEYEAPREIDTQEVRRRSREIRTIAQNLLDVDDEHLFYKQRKRQRGESQYERTDTSDRFHEITEGDCRLWVNFDDYLDTGLFLDHRPVRTWIQREANGKNFLNLFGYTGAATVHAAKGGAASTVTVDMSRTYLDWAERNLRLNDLSGNQHRFIQADCVTWLEQDKSSQFDLVFLDPPTFSNSKRMKHTLDIQRDHESLIRRTMRRTARDGTLYFSTNLRGFRLAAAISADFRVEDVTRQSIPHDFERRQNIHHCFRIRHPV